MKRERIELIDKDEFWKWLESKYCYTIDTLKRYNPETDAVIDDINLKIDGFNKANDSLLDATSKNLSVKKFLDRGG